MDRLANLLERARRKMKPSRLCRDCADNNGRCPNTGELCSPIDCADEIADGIENEVQSLQSQLAEAEAKVEHMQGVVEAAKNLDDAWNSTRPYISGDFDKLGQALKALEDEDEHH